MARRSALENTALCLKCLHVVVDSALMNFLFYTAIEAESSRLRRVGLGGRMPLRTDGRRGVGWGLECRIAWAVSRDSVHRHAFLTGTVTTTSDHCLIWHQCWKRDSKQARRG